MSPDQIRIQELENKVNTLMEVIDVSFIENIKRRIGVEGSINSMIDAKIAATELNDLLNVDVPSPTNGQVLKYTTSGTDRWVAGTDNTA